MQSKGGLAINILHLNSKTFGAHDNVQGLSADG